MDLRRLSIQSLPASGFLASRRLAAFVALGALLGLVPLAGTARGAAGDYPNPLYLGGGPSSVVSGSYKLIGTPGRASLPAPTTTRQAGSGMTIGSYTYLYTVVDGGGESAPSAPSSPTVTTIAGEQQVILGDLPTGVTVRIYRRRSSLFFRVAELLDNTSATYVDSSADPPPGSIALPQSQNRVATVFSSICGATNCGWTEFAPGVPVNASSNSTIVSSAPTAPTAKGWLVDASGGVHFAEGDWTFTVQTKSGVSPNGVARLVIGMWKVTAAGTPVGEPLIDPAGAGEQTSTNLIDTTNSAKTFTHAIPLPAFSLAEDERLYVQFWRRQVAPYTSGSPDARTVTLFAHDGASRVTHPAVSTLPNEPGLHSPAVNASTVTNVLFAVHTDPDTGDTGTIEFRVCTSPAAAGSECSDLVASGASASVPTGATAEWAIPASLTPGATYHWQARAQDALGGRSPWSATRSFVVDKAPARPALAAPHPGAYVRAGAPRLKAKFTDPDGDTGRVSFRICKRPSRAGTKCAKAVATGSSVAVEDGAIASWTARRSLRDRTYYWQARAEDGPGAESGWTATRRLVLAKRLIRITSSRRLTCTVGGLLAAHVRLAKTADVTAHFYTRGRFDYARRLGTAERGTKAFRLNVPYTLERPTVYWVKWTAEARAETGRAWMRVELRPLRPGHNPPPCRTDLS